MDTRKKDRKLQGFYRARLDDSAILYKVIDSDEFPFAIAETIQRLKNAHIYVFISSTEDAIIVYEPVYGSVPWVNTHTWTLPSCRGAKLKEFYLRTGMWIVENTDYSVITMLVPDRLRRQGLFLSAIGAKRQCEVMGEVLYTFDELQYDGIKKALGPYKRKRRRT